MDPKHCHHFHFSPKLDTFNKIRYRSYLSSYLLLIFTYDSNSLTELLLNWNWSTEHEINYKSFDLCSVIIMNLIDTILSYFPIPLHVVLKRNCSSNLYSEHSYIYIVAYSRPNGWTDEAEIFLCSLMGGHRLKNENIFSKRWAPQLV